MARTDNQHEGIPMDKYELLKTYFGHSAFRDGQETIVDTLAAGKDALCVMPTGAGKSVCYQIPALLADGIALVVSPLISLMKDQVGSLVQNGIKAAYINSSLTPAQYATVIARAVEGRYKIIYVAPERLLAGEFISFCLGSRISLIAVDEAHCVSQWGQDFRPSYLRIAEFIRRLPYRPAVGAFTATATKEVGNDIIRILGLRDPLAVSTGFDRKNLYFGVRRPKKKPDELLLLLRGYRGKSGIVYCSTRRQVEEVCDALNRARFPATRYHAGLSAEERLGNQDDFIFDRTPVIVATNAFGMGIDKSNVSFVIHYNMPKNIESYYQEAGRAGRDGEKADCILLWSARDVQTQLYFIENGNENPELDAQTREKVREGDRLRLKQMTAYCRTADCLRAFILNYFGEKSAHFCGNCSNCLTEFREADVSAQAVKIIGCVSDCGQRYGIKIISDILRGQQSEKVRNYGLFRQASFGILAGCAENELREIIGFLLAGGYLGTADTAYPVLTLTEKAVLFLRDPVFLPMKQSASHVKKCYAGTAAGQPEDFSAELLLKLKELRKKIADTEGVPAYVVFSDATLREMCVKKPASVEALLDVSGVGRIKQQKYGRRFVEVIRGAADRS